MTVLQTLNAHQARGLSKLLGPLVVTASFFAAYFPTIKSLIDGPWQTEQEGHGPLIIAAALWLAWQSRKQLAMTALSPAPVAGWAMLLFGLILMFLARTQGVLTVEA